MRNRTFVLIVIVIAILASGALVLLADGQSGVGDWLRSLHGGGGH